MAITDVPTQFSIPDGVNNPTTQYNKEEHEVDEEEDEVFETSHEHLALVHDYNPKETQEEVLSEYHVKYA